MKKYLIIILASILLMLSLISVLNAKKPLYSGNISDFFAGSKSENLIEGSYKKYYNTYKNYPIITNQTVDIDVFQNIVDTDTDIDVLQYDDGILTYEEGSITWHFNVEDEGLYYLKVEYTQVVEIESLNIKGKTSSAERILKIDGKIPFSELENVRFSRVWEDETEILVNHFGDQVRPKQVEKPQRVTTYVRDYENYIVEPYYIYLSKGLHTITFESVREPLIIHKLTFEGQEPVKTYEEVLQEYEQKGLEIVENGYIKVEGEHMYEKNSPTMIPLADTSSYNTFPQYKGDKTVLNVMGIYSWRLPGYWISYEIDVEKEGLYALNFRMKQDIKQGSFVSRQITINGEIPFKEASYVPFTYNSNFNNYVIGTKESPYLFHLKEGKNYIRLDVSLGNIGEIISQAKETMNILNKLYLDIIMYTTVSPQKYRDYQLEKNIPNLLNILNNEYQRLSNILNDYKTISKNQGGQTSVLTNLIMQLDRFIKKPSKIVNELTSFESNISAIGTWIQNEQEQPLTIDYLAFFDPNMKIERGKDHIFETIWHEFRKFIYSFISNNDRYQSDKSGEKIRVWVTAGRDNAQILRRIIDDYFESDINVELELVNKDVLLRATVSGQGPDVALMVPEGTPIDFAFRNAAYDLSRFDDFDTIAQRFYESALTPFRYKGGVYALPEQQTFPVLFYRSDIFKDLNLQTPETWEDVYELFRQLNTQNLDFFVESGSTSLSTTLTNSVNSGLYGTLLYQHQGTFYLNDGKETGLLTEEANNAFKMFSQFFTNYGVPVQANFVNRFRSGEIAAGIVDYSTYNTLVVFAPEISGKWNISLVPGLDAQNRVVTSNVPYASMILDHSTKKESAWEFLKWWVSSETQVAYARELETVMGAAARYPTANIEALNQLSWPTKDLKVISNQMALTVGIPQVPGGYMTTRQFTYALLAVVNDGYNPIEALNEYAREINKELILKREEFNLD